MSISAIEPLDFTAADVPVVPMADVNPVDLDSTGIDTSLAFTGTEFADMLATSMDNLDAVQDRADQLSVQAATGDLEALHDYTIAATEASVTTQLTVAVRNRAVEAFNEIMRMQV